MVAEAVLKALRRDGFVYEPDFVPFQSRAAWEAIGYETVFPFDRNPFKPANVSVDGNRYQCKPC